MVFDGPSSRGFAFRYVLPPPLALPSFGISVLGRVPVWVLPTVGIPCLRNPCFRNFPSGVASANQTKERAKTKSSRISPIVVGFWCFSLGKQARFTANFCSRLSPGKVREQGLSVVWIAGGTPDPTVGIPAFGIPTFGILVDFRHPFIRHPLDFRYFRKPLRGPPTHGVPNHPPPRNKKRNSQNPENPDYPQK